MEGNYIKLNPLDFPLRRGESWWIVHPNLIGAEFIVPNEGTTACIKELKPFFKEGIIYTVFSSDLLGWVKVKNVDTVVEMPQYIFARYFDAEIFVRGSIAANRRRYIPGLWIDEER